MAEKIPGKTADFIIAQQIILVTNRTCKSQRLVSTE